MGGGAWSFLVGGVICLVNSDNERDLFLETTFDLSLIDLELLSRTIIIEIMEG